jgi:putative ABC transport system permease protein
MRPVDHRLALCRPALPSARSKKSFSSASSPILACSVFTSTGWSAAEVDPTIRLTEVKLLTGAGGGEAQGNWALTAVAWLVSLIVLLLSATGIHALMSFIVARRTREIGIRAALGAHPRRIIAGIFGRAFLQVSAGLIAGSALVAWTGLGSTREVLVLLAADGIMLAAGLTACYVPLRRALGINPTEALRAEA